MRLLADITFIVATISTLIIIHYHDAGNDITFPLISFVIAYSIARFYCIHLRKQINQLNFDLNHAYIAVLGRNVNGEFSKVGILQMDNSIYRTKKDAFEAAADFIRTHYKERDDIGVQITSMKFNVCEMNDDENDTDS